MSAILQLIQAANAEAERLRHMAQTATSKTEKRKLIRTAERWADLATKAMIEFTLLP